MKLYDWNRTFVFRTLANITHLVELQNVEQLEEFAVLLVVLQLDVVLLEAVKGQLGLIVDVDLHRLK